jgi:hypothetical protein
MLTNSSQVQQDLLIGTLLGDGNLQTRTKGKTWLYRAKQGKIQKDYLFHKFYILQSFCKTTPKEYVGIDKRSNKKQVYWRFDTLTFKELAFFGHTFYIFNEKTQKWIKDVPLDIAHFLTPRALAYWFMDDGFLKRYWKSYKSRTPAYYFNGLQFCTNSFSYAGVIILKEALKNLYGLNATIIIHGRSKKTWIPQYILKISNKEAVLLRELIKPFMLESFLYKLDF